MPILRIPSSGLAITGGRIHPRGSQLGDVRALGCGLNRCLSISGGSGTAVTGACATVDHPDIRGSLDDRRFRESDSNARLLSLVRICPTQEDRWHCDCGHEWDTFTTNATCPECGQQHKETWCPRCESAAPHANWYHSEVPTPFLHCCENCAKPVSRDRFPQPPNTRATVVRYLTFDKYRRLREGALYLVRLDRFEDPFEGSLPGRALAEISRGGRTNFFEHEEDRHLWTKQFCVSCWHMAAAESDAMWRLYCGNDVGVCIVSTYARLSKLKSGTPLHLGLVRYIDYRTQNFSWVDSYAPMMHKRRAYEHEKEVRIVAGAEVCNVLLSPRSLNMARLEKQPRGFRLACNVNALITRVVVSPYATNSGFEEVMDLTRTFAPGLCRVLRWSRMRDSPSF